MKGETVELQDMLLCRERRSALQEKFRAEYGKPVLSFCMNIPGPVKTTPRLRLLFEEGRQMILAALEKNDVPVLAQLAFHEKTGDELLLCVDGDAAQLKVFMTAIETDHPLGRLFDIDVLDETGRKLSREGCRTCLICGRQAQDCARARRHTVAEMQGTIEAMLAAYDA
ncbi:MAG: citrate lyase holo-[acyl-carrier protein] synthase [Oscillospiraceae bacterium]|nr:citrate lyase holo-[acyl-carrier protein] synthase [Oscillospiraceae bacterium]